MVDSITHTMDSGVAEGAFPGGVLFVRFHDEAVYHHAVGRTAHAPDAQPVTVETLYDLASLTKPLATTTAVLHLIQQGKVRLADTVEYYFPEFVNKAIGSATVAHLLHHSSGLPGWRPLYEEIAEREQQTPGFLGSARAKQFALETIGSQPLVHHVGDKSLYSDLGFILLGLLIERVTGLSLALFCREQIYEPLGIQDLLFRPNVTGSVPGNQSHYSIASTEEDPWRGRVLTGEVHDENAYALGGVGGHAGLFGTAGAVMRMVDVWLDAYFGRSTALVPALVRQFVTRDGQQPASTWGLGWDTPSEPSSSGRYLSTQAFGHLGFTGTSIWVDPKVELEIVLLTNRVNPTRRNTQIQQFRPLLHDTVYRRFVNGFEG
ncbi:MAG: serine hydrolase domain-containing protein [Chloroflexota bacterium]